MKNFTPLLSLFVVCILNLFPSIAYGSDSLTNVIESPLVSLNSYGADGIYDVKEGDTMFGIAFAHNIAVSKLKELNYLTNDDLYVGQILKVSDIQKLNGKTIAIDPGHGGYETGAIQNEVEEQHVALDVSLSLKRQLESEGAKVILSRENELSPYQSLPLADRAALSLQSNADAFISVHFNSHPDSSVSGSETYFNESAYKGEQNPYPSESKTLATYIQNSLASTIHSKNLGVKENDFHVLRNNTVPSALVEVAFISNVFESKSIKKFGYKEKAAYGITKGVVSYFDK